jgi:FkbM family methyltransferase
MKISRDSVCWAYRAILGREPENEKIINACLTVPDFETLRRNIISSSEFQKQLFEGRFNEFEEGKMVRCDIRNDLILYIDLTDQYVSMACLRDDYEPIETTFIKDCLKSGDTFIDIGANIGWHTINAAYKVGKSGHVYAFEPRNLSRKLLQRSIIDNNFGERVTVSSNGIGKNIETVILKWATHGVNPGGATIDPTINLDGHSTQTIELIELDSIDFKKIKLIKIDIEGAEFLAMQGAVNTLKKHRPIILSEIIKGQIDRVSGGDEIQYLDFMKMQGYTCFSLGAKGIENELIATNIFNDSDIVNVVFMPN